MYNCTLAHLNLYMILLYNKVCFNLVSGIIIVISLMSISKSVNDNQVQNLHLYKPSHVLCTLLCLCRLFILYINDEKQIVFFKNKLCCPFKHGILGCFVIQLIVLFCCHTVIISIFNLIIDFNLIEESHPILRLV